MLPDRKNYTADIVIPCYQEQDVLPVTIPSILDYMRALVADDGNGLSSFRMLLVDDGSHDATWQAITDLAAGNAEIHGVKLARNFGHQSALLSGLSLAISDVAISMDADLQDDISAIRAFLAAYEGGADLALGVRADRSSDTRAKRTSANAYYRMLSLLGAGIVENHGDFRLMSRKAIEALLQYQEVNLFLRGIIPTLGFSVALIPYTRQPRSLGETKYTFPRMARLALDGITSFSITPLRFISALGSVSFAISVVIGTYYLMQRLLLPESVVPGWASIVLPMLFFGGLQILSIGVLGEYVGKIYMEVKRRPRFIVEKTTDDDR